MEKKIDMTTQVKQEFNLKYESDPTGLVQKPHNSAIHYTTKGQSVIDNPAIDVAEKTSNLGDLRPPETDEFDQARRRSSLDGPAPV